MATLEDRIVNDYADVTAYGVKPSCVRSYAQRIDIMTTSNNTHLKIRNAIVLAHHPEFGPCPICKGLGLEGELCREGCCEQWAVPALQVESEVIPPNATIVRVECAGGAYCSPCTHCLFKASKKSDFWPGPSSPSLGLFHL